MAGDGARFLAGEQDYEARFARDVAAMHCFAPTA
jgi:hypothetical protein